MEKERERKREIERDENTVLIDQWLCGRSFFGPKYTTLIFLLTATRLWM